MAVPVEGGEDGHGFTSLWAVGEVAERPQFDQMALIRRAGRVSPSRFARRRLLLDQVMGERLQVRRPRDDVLLGGPAALLRLPGRHSGSSGPSLLAACRMYRATVSHSSSVRWIGLVLSVSQPHGLKSSP